MDQTPDSTYHEPVMVREVIELLAPIPPGIVVDATYGGGGHSARIREQLGRDVIGIDRDVDATSRDPSVKLANFADIGQVLDGEGPVAGVLFDLGVSSHQLDERSRGFSYRAAGPLDMRMGPDAPVTAGEIVNEWEEREIANVLREYGEERFSRRVAAAIVRERPIRDTAHLAEVVRSAIPAATRRVGGHPARRTFQALRIAVNAELDALRSGLDAAIDVLRPGGRCVVISYHSLEDRIVKRRFTEGATGCICPPELPVCGCGRSAELRIITRSPLRASEEEIDRNPRARSARLRAAEKVAA